MQRYFISTAVLMAMLSSGSNADPTCPLIQEGELCPAGCFLTATELRFPIESGAHQCVPAGFGYYSPANSNYRDLCPVGTYSDIQTATVCRDCVSGSFAFSKGTIECNLCPSGSFADTPRASHCQTCNDEYYAGEGSNAAEFWNDDLYCMDPSAETASPTSAPSAAPTSVAGTDSPTDSPTSQPTSAPSSAPTPVVTSMSPTTMVDTDAPSAAPTTNSTQVPEDEFLVDEFELLECELEDDKFQWHRSCRQCPSKAEAGIFTALTVGFLVAVLVVLERVLPKCSTGTMWVGLEYLQLLYLVSYLDMEWPPVARYLMEKIVPVFALDFSANISGQCLFGWDKGYDQIVMIVWPFALWIVAATVALWKKNMSYKDVLCHRWPLVTLNIGLVALFQSSKDALDFSAIWGATVMGVPTTNYFAGIAGMAGLAMYFAYIPFFAWGLYKYKTVVVSGQEGSNQPYCDEESQCSFNTSANPGRNFWFMSMGLFPEVNERVWGWPMAWIVRKMLFFVLLQIKPLSPQFLLICLFCLVAGSFFLQTFLEPFPSQGEEKRGNLWHHSKKTDIALSGAFLAMALVGLLALNVDLTSRATWLSVLPVTVFTASLLFWLFATYKSSKLRSEDCQSFAAEARDICESMASASNDTDDGEDDASDEDNTARFAVPVEHLDQPASSSTMGSHPSASAPPQRTALYGMGMRSELDQRLAARGRVESGDNDIVLPNRPARRTHEDLVVRNNNNRPSSARNEIVFHQNDYDDDDDDETFADVYVLKDGDETVDERIVPR
ncbi:MAG: hypothetical protein SGILL_006814 [Bacillariaceae sp.]